MNIARSRTNSDPRVAQLLGQADVARAKKEFQVADKLEGEAEALVAEEQQTEQLDIAVRLKTRFKPTVVVLAPKESKVKVKDLKLEHRIADHMTRQKDCESVKMSRVPLQDRTRLLAMLGQIPSVVPFAQMFKPQTPSGNGDTTQYGLAATGAGLMAVEPAAGGVLLMFSCLINAVHEESAPETEEERTQVEEEELQETSRAGLFTAKPDKLGWIIA